MCAGGGWGGSCGSDGGAILDTIAVEFLDIKRFLSEFVNVQK